MTVLRSPHVNKKSREQFEIARTSGCWILLTQRHRLLMR